MPYGIRPSFPWLSNPKNVQQPAERSRRVGSATESEHKKTIPRFEFVHQILVGIGHVVRNAVAEAEPNRAGPPFSDLRQPTPGW
jgi:hypothetical protein